MATFAEIMPEVINNNALASRSGWNGKGMFILWVKGSKLPTQFLRQGSAYAALSKHLKLGPDEEFTINGHFDMRTADGSMTVGWVPTQVDMAADDWEVLGNIDAQH